MEGDVELLAAVQRAERSESAAQLANALTDLAEHYHLAERYEDAAPVYQRALGSWREILGPEHPAVATLLINLGQIYLYLDRLDDALPLFRQGLGIFENDVQFDDPGVVDALERFVARLHKAGRSEEAEMIAVRVQRIAEQVPVTVKA